MQLIENKRSGSFLIAEISAIRKNHVRSRTFPQIRFTHKLPPICACLSRTGSTQRICLSRDTGHGPRRIVSARYQYSNRHSYEKLEVRLTRLPSTQLPVLIDTKTHFVQGENAQFQCTSPRRNSPEPARNLLPDSDGSWRFRLRERRPIRIINVSANALEDSCTP